MSVPGAVLFDLDGTLSDSAPALAAALNVVWRDRGRPPASLAAVKGWIGDGPAALIERARAAIGLPADAAATVETEAFMDALAAGGPGGAAYPGALETLACLKRQGLRLAVCTNKPQTAAEALLSGLGMLPLLDGVVGGDATPRRKPDRAHVEAALATLPGAIPANAVLVGDGLQDVMAAEAAGVAAIVAAYGYGGAAERRPDLPAIGALGELPDVLRRLGLLQAGKSPENTPT